MHAKDQNQDRRHQRTAAHAREADQKADDKAGERIEKIETVGRAQRLTLRRRCRRGAGLCIYAALDSASGSGMSTYGMPTSKRWFRLSAQTGLEAKPTFQCRYQDMTEQERFYITTPIFYPNGAPHIGHAYTAIATDVMARFQRLEPRGSFPLRHGRTRPEDAADGGERGHHPLALADRNSAVFRDLLKRLNCSNDDFIRTTEERHRIAVQALWKKMEERGRHLLATYGGWYSVRQEAYFDESETTVGTDGVRREPLGSPVEWSRRRAISSSSPPTATSSWLTYEAHPEFIGPSERRNEVISFVKSGLKDLSISRTTFNWGIPVPGNPAHVMYVWVDALTNYITRPATRTKTLRSGSSGLRSTSLARTSSVSTPSTGPPS